MDGWLKGLMAAVCVMVIAAGGYFLVSELRAKWTQEEASRHDLEVLACKGSLQATDDNLIKMREDCLNRGLITADEYWASKKPAPRP